MRATALIEPGPVDRLLTVARATPADWSTTKADPHNEWTNRRGPVIQSQQDPDHNFSHAEEKDVIENGYIGEYNPHPNNINHPYVEYQLQGIRDGVAGTYEVGGYWSGDYFIANHTWFVRG